MLARHPGWVSGDAGPVLREMRHQGLWALVGSLGYWLYASASNYMLAGLFNIKAVADVNATRLLVMPVITVTVGMQALLNPTAALWLAEMGVARLVRRLFLFLIGLILLDLAYLAVVWVSRDWVFGTILHKHADQRDELLLLWAGVALIGVARDVMQSAIVALGRAKYMAGQSLVCAAVSLSVTLIGVSRWGAAVVLIAQMVGELVNFVGICLQLRGVQRVSDGTPATST
jgi:O-antigen/teichoic acid export membrane protein